MEYVQKWIKYQRGSKWVPQNVPCLHINYFEAKAEWEGDRQEA